MSRLLVTNQGTYYKGYTIYEHHGAPVTGRWRAEHFGVGMCNSTREGLMRMIDQRVREAIEERRMKGIL